MGASAVDSLASCQIGASKMIAHAHRCNVTVQKSRDNEEGCRHTADLLPVLQAARGVSSGVSVQYTKLLAPHPPRSAPQRRRGAGPLAGPGRTGAPRQAG